MGPRTPQPGIKLRPRLAVRRQFYPPCRCATHMGKKSGSIDLPVKYSTCIFPNCFQLSFWDTRFATDCWDMDLECAECGVRSPNMSI